MPKVLHLVLTERVNALLVDYCAERLDRPAKTAVVRELLAKELSTFERARATRRANESRAAILAARAERAKPRRRRGLGTRPPWLDVAREPESPPES